MGIERWRNKVALVTGASAGIGEAVALALSEVGMKVALTARREDRLKAIADQISRRGGDVIVLPGDARDSGQIENVCRTLRDEWGGIDVLINSAGLGRVAPLLSGSADAWKEMFEVNVIGLSVFTREAIGDMRAHGDQGYVIHISSMSGHRVPDGTGGMYSATKHAVRALTEALRRELRTAGSRIRVSAISPGFVETEFAEVMSGSKQTAQQVYARFPCLQPDEIAAQVVHLLSQPEHVQIHDVLLRPLEQPS